MLNRFVSIVRKYSPFTKTVQVNIPVTESDKLSGRTALIFGGSGGIGEGIARAITNAGATVILIGTNEKKLRMITDSLNGARYKIIDLSNITTLNSSLNELYIQIKRTIDIMVYAAGVHGGSDFFSINEEEYDQVLDLNMKAMFFAAQSFAKYLIEKKAKGNILLLGSASSVKPAWCPYEISKWSVRGFTLGLARELVPYGIVVNGIAPGPVKTRMIHMDNADELNWPANPTGRICTVEEIGELAVFMLSGSGQYIIGDTVFISGGSGNINIDK